MKIRLTAILTAILFCTTITSAQALKTWKENVPIDWEDFHISGPAEVHSAFKGVLAVENSAQKDGTFTLCAIAKMDCDRSYADPIVRKEYRTLEEITSDSLLMMHQLEFDLLETYARDLQEYINEKHSQEDIQKKANYYMSLYDKNIEQIRTQTANGSDKQAMDTWRMMIDSRLQEQGIPPQLTLRQSHFKYGFNIGTGLDAVTGSLKDNMSNTWNFNIGAHIGYKRLMAKFEFLYGQPSVKNSHLAPAVTPVSGHNYQADVTDSYSSYINLNLALGLLTLDTKYLSITPYFGYAWNRHGWNTGIFEEVTDEAGTITKNYVDHKSVSSNNHSWYAAIAFDIHFITTAPKKNFFLGDNVSYVNSIRIMPYITQNRSKDFPEMRGMHIGFTISYFGLARALSR